MSKGHGVIQRHILEQLKLNTTDAAGDDRKSWRDPTRGASWTTVLDLAGDGNATRAQIQSTRRAVLTLRDAGMVEISYVAREVSYVRREYGAWRQTINGQQYYDPDMPCHRDRTAHPRMLAARLSVENVPASVCSQHLPNGGAA